MKSSAGDLGFPPITCGLQAHRDAARDSLPRRPPLACIDGELLATEAIQEKPEELLQGMLCC